MRIGLGSWTYGWAVGFKSQVTPVSPMKPVDIVRKAAELGVTVVQLCDNVALHERGDIELKELVSIAKGQNIALQIGTVSVEPQHLRKYLELALKLDAKLVRTISVFDIDRYEKEHVARCLCDVANDYKDAGVILALENHDHFKCSEIVDIMNIVNNPYVGVCLDTVNSFGALEGPEQVINMMAPYTVNLHFKDFDIFRVSNKMGFIIEGRPAGEGRLDVDMILKSLRDCHRDPDIIVELWTPFEDDVVSTIKKEASWAEKSVAYLKEKLKM